MNIRPLVLAAAFAVVTGPGLAQQGSPPVERRTKVVAERPARVFVMASFDKTCAATAAPVIVFDQVPGKGTVSLREGQMTTIQSSLSGACIGVRVPGTGIYYTAAKGQTGRDTFSITARLATGEVASRTFTVEIAED